MKDKTFDSVDIPHAPNLVDCCTCTINICMHSFTEKNVANKAVFQLSTNNWCITTTHVLTNRLKLKRDQYPDLEVKTLYKQQ